MTAMAAILHKLARRLVTKTMAEQIRDRFLASANPAPVEDEV
jgi:hypothetical protein